MKNFFKFYRTYHLIEKASKTSDSCLEISDAPPFVLVFNLADCYSKNEQYVIAERAFNQEVERKLIAKHERLNPSRNLSDRLKRKRRELFIPAGSVALGQRRFFKKGNEYIEKNTFYPKAEHIHKDLELLKILKVIPHKKICLINCPVEKATLMLNELGLQEYYDQICCTRDILYESKLADYKQIEDTLRGFIKQLDLHKNTKLVCFDYSKEHTISISEMGHIAYFVEKPDQENSNLKDRLEDFKLEHHVKPHASDEIMREEHQPFHQEGLRRRRVNKSELGMQNSLYSAR